MLRSNMKETQASCLRKRQDASSTLPARRLRPVIGGGESGVALLIAIAFLAILGIGSGVLWSQLHGRLEHAGQFEERETARALAEAGIEKAIAALAQDRSYTGESETPIGDGVFSVEVFAQAEEQYRVIGTGVFVEEGQVMARQELAAELRFAPGGGLAAYIPLDPKEF